MQVYEWTVYKSDERRMAIHNASGMTVIEEDEGLIGVYYNKAAFSAEGDIEGAIVLLSTHELDPLALDPYESMKGASAPMPTQLDMMLDGRVIVPVVDGRCGEIKNYSDLNDEYFDNAKKYNEVLCSIA